MSFTIQPAEGPLFIDREKELRDILDTLKDPASSIGFALYGRRRVGKTSIFKETRCRLMKKEKEIVPIYFSLWDLIENTLPEFVKELSAAILEAYRPHLSIPHRAKDIFSLPINFIKNLFAGLKLSVEVQDSLTFIFSSGKEKVVEPGVLIDEVFVLPERLAHNTKKKSVLLLDEFPDIMELKVNGKRVEDAIIKKIRTIQEGYKNTSLNVSGSIRKTMEQTVFSSASAFYRQFIIREICPFSKEAVRELMDKNLTTGRLTDKGISLLYEFTGGIPFYVQFLGRLLDKYPHNTITVREVRKAIEEFLLQEGDILFKEELERLGDKERRIVITMATRNLSAFSEISSVLKAQITNLGQYLSYLEDKELLHKEQRGIYNFTDPIFKEWLAERF